ncbi:GIY-YIG nuclease family protein [Cobetia sp. 5-11-6-3]|uniref:GIY-YIG nuclease family protein n=1 Tax=Cobetia sp. 5-11-6-3 TaxID=2737458 RepID=UPI001596BA9A|nr:GIY-YIG nuclease family protein [Cobetia sp. 5-11-6-3]
MPEATVPEATVPGEPCVADAAAQTGETSSEWWLYVLETAQGRLYTGISTDVTRRLSEHAGGKRGARALRGKGPLTLCYQQAVGDRSRALKLEYRVKQLSVSAKRRLIAGELTLESLLG